MNSESILNPSIFFGSFELREPVTSLTDFMVGITCWIAVWYYHKNKADGSDTWMYYRNYFLFFAIGMTSAAWLGHGFQAYISPKWKMIGWLCSLSGQMFLAQGSLIEIKSMISEKLSKTIKVLIYSQYLILVGLILYPETSDFKFAQIGAALALSGFVLPMQLFHFIKSKNKGSLLIVVSIVYGLAPGFVFNNQISVNRWFNYHDISHVLVCVLMILMIFGTRKLALLTFKNSSKLLTIE
jgi:hypothetical protein